MPHSLLVFLFLISPSVFASPLGQSCHDERPGHLCLAIKYVAYTNADAAAGSLEQQAIRNIQEANRPWSKCNLGFELEKFVWMDPAARGRRRRIGDYSELEEIRSEFSDGERLLVVVTAAWDRRRELGKSAANAWTSLPLGGPYGAILERPESDYPNVLAHELGHYLNLRHAEDRADVMHPIIYASSSELSPDQCVLARATVTDHWSRMLR